jgi:hypothetical protein
MNRLSKGSLPVILTRLTGFIALLIVLGQLGAIVGTPASAWNSSISYLVVGILGLLIIGLSVYQLGILPGEEPTPQPPLVINESRTELTILDKEGRRARAIKTQDLLATIPNVRMMTERAMGADGQVRVLDYACGDLEVSMEPLIIPPKDRVELRFTFITPPKPNVKYERRFQYELTDSFLEDREYFTIRITRQVETLVLVINLPTDRPLTRAWLRYTEQMIDVELEHEAAGIELNAPPGSATTMTYRVHKPILGSVHQIWWDW